MLEGFKKLGAYIGGKFYKKLEGEEAKKVLSTSPRSKPLFDLIGDKESGGNYNAYYGNASNKDVVFTNMKLKDVRSWQDTFVRSGSRSSAVGKYQIIRKTMDSLIKEMGLTGDEIFNEDLQDKMAETLANRRGYDKWRKGKIDDNTFANNLAKEWASFPVIGGSKHGRSYYAGDGLNKALISPDSVLSALSKEKGYAV